MYRSYADVVRAKEAQYGAYGTVGSRYKNATGVCYLNLVDFDRNGTNELVLVYERTQSTFPNHVYTFEVWSDATKPVKRLATGNLCVFDAYSQAVRFLEYNGQYFLVEGSGDDDGSYNYYGYSGSSFGVAHTCTWDYVGSRFTFDGKSMTYQAFDKVVSKEPFEEVMVSGSNISKLPALIKSTKAKINY